MKKILAILLALAMVFAFAACVPAADPAPADDQDVEMEEELDNITGKKIGFINAGPDDYYAQFGDAFKAIGEAVGFVVTEVNSDYLPEKELANVQDMIAQGIDAIAVITVGAAGSAASIEAAYEADVLINIGNTNPYQEPSKVIEYASTGKPIINITTIDCDSSSVLLEGYPAFLNVVVPDFQTTPGFVSGLLEFIANPPHVQKPYLEKWVAPYTIENVSNSYLSMFDCERS